MSQGFTQTSFASVLKEWYDDDGLTNATYKQNPYWAKLPKKSAGGLDFIHPVQYATAQGRRTVFSQAQSSGNATSALFAKFAMTRVENWQSASVSTELFYSSKTDRGSFVDAVVKATEDCMRNLGNAQSVSLFGDGTGKRGALISTQSVSSSVITLSIAANAVYFEVGMELDLCASGTTTPRAYGSAGHGLYVGKVDRIGGTVTVVTTLDGTVTCAINDATNGIPTAAASDDIFIRADENAVLEGFGSWIVYGGPTAALFNGVDRTSDPVRLAGLWLDGTNMSLAEALIQSASNVMREGGELTHFAMSYGNFANLIKSQAARVQIISNIRDQITPDIGFDGVELMTSAGPVIVMPDRNCPPDKVYGLNMDTWLFEHIADPVQLFDIDGNTVLRQATDSGVEMRFFSTGQLVCREPRSNIVIKVPAA